ncbi:MAG: hypothetical protein Aurels2KO_52200 [Aureliella sp.]
MSNEVPNQLMPEDDIRAALRIMRPDASEFAAAVHAKLRHLSQRGGDDPSLTRSTLDEPAWLRVAASLLPVQVFGKSIASKGASVAIAQLSFGQKVLAIIALPGVFVLLASLVVIWAFLQLRKSVLRQTGDYIATDQMMQASQRISSMAIGLNFAILAGLLLSYFGGVQIPAAAFFLAPAFVLVIVVSQLANEQLLDRRIVGSFCAVLLGFMGQVLVLMSLTAVGTPLLDQHLLNVIALLGLVVVVVLLKTNAFGRSSQSLQNHRQQVRSNRLVVVFALCGGLLAAAWFGRSYWQPVTTAEMQTYVESFDKAKFGSSSWEDWSIPARWLNAKGVELELERPKRALATSIDQKTFVPSIVNYGIDMGILGPAELSRRFDLDFVKRTVFPKYQTPHTRIGVIEPSIRVLNSVGALNDAERNELGRELDSMLWELKSNRVMTSPIRAARQIVELASEIDRPIDTEKHREWIHEMLGSLQSVESSGRRKGGFVAYPQVAASDHRATNDAVLLMETFGVPESVDLLALRSYLRPALSDRFRGLQPRALVRKATQERLESLPDVPGLSWTDYVRCEHNLIMVSLLVLLCIYATLAAPALTQSPVQTEVNAP